MNQKKPTSPAAASVLAVGVIVAGIGIAASSCSSEGESGSASPGTTAAADATGPLLAHHGCADIGGRFEVHGTDGRGSCVSADPRPACHIKPADQPENYVAEITLSPPFPYGEVDWDSGVLTAVNADCWHAPH